MNRTLRDELKLIEEALEQGEHSRALSLIESIDLTKAQELCSVETSRLFCFHAKCLFFLGDYSAAHGKISDALQLSRCSADHSLYASQQLVLGLIHQATGRLDEAIEEFNGSYAARRRAGENDKLWGSLLNLALTHFYKGDLLQSLNVFRSALRYATEYNTESDISLCKRNICLVLLLTGDFASFRDILKTIDIDSDDVLGKVRIRELSGKYDVWALNYERAKTSLLDALTFYENQGLVRDQVVCLEYLGMNDYFSGSHARAREQFLQILEMPGLRASAVAQTLRMLADVYVAEGDWEKAKETAERAEEAITKISERIELGALYRAYGQIYEHLLDRQKAREYFDKSIDLLYQLGARYELALTRFACGRSSCYTREIRLDHLERARSLFTAMDVCRRVTQVEEAIVELSREVKNLKVSIDPNPNCGDSKGILIYKKTDSKSAMMIAGCRQMQDIIAYADQIKNKDMTILITGETGTGKDLLAEYIHYTSRRQRNRYQVINCANISAELFESELFGYKKGIYTGANRDKIGLIETAAGGTFCFDEIGDLSLDVQVKLLRVIESKQIRPVGDTVDTSVDVRFLAITNRELGEMVEKGTFRRDLYHRLQDAPIQLPPLRERDEDILLLFNQFLHDAGVIDNGYGGNLIACIMDRMNGYRYPGNIRELRQLVERLSTYSFDRPSEQIPDKMASFLCGNGNGNAEHPSLRDVILASLNRHAGNQSKAARELNMPRTTLRSQMKRYHIG